MTHIPINVAASEFLTTEEVITFLRVNTRTLYRLIRTGDFPAVRVGRQWRFRRTDLEAWLRRDRPAS
jgi:excisionase family DNA binding protein